MSLLEIYKEKNNDKEWFDSHFSSSSKAFGKMFIFTGTNFRTLESFFKQFSTFLEIEGKPRKFWPKKETTGQEMHKQHVTNMLQSKLFKKDIGDDEVYSKTRKGFLYDDFIKLEIGDEEKWLINYLFLLNGYYSNVKNYIVYRVKRDLLGYLLSVPSINVDLLTNEAKNFLNLEDKTFSSLLRSSFFYIHSFYNDSDFLINYFRASEQEKEELASYIEENYNENNLRCCISRKYKSEVITKNTLVDETKIFLLTLRFSELKDVFLTNIREKFVEEFSENIFRINESIVLNYLYVNKNVFDPIFEDVLELDEEETQATDALIESPRVIERDAAEDYIDETIEIGKQKIKEIYSVRRKQAKLQSNYTCALENINNCKPIYFTAKAGGKNYLETHHLIPREFRNDFSYSIEVLANYITLCPRCHRQIHFAVDRERKHLINALYNERKHRLSLVRLDLDTEKMYEYYKINS